ncbi:MAG: helix-turn-helix domain-containing protein [Clostridia bacterium]|nr:helix-turn-helix domain-containing protein [Clostridia bacterium]
MILSDRTLDLSSPTGLISRQVASKWESGTSDPNTTSLMALAKLYDVAAEDIYEETK